MVRSLLPLFLLTMAWPAQASVFLNGVNVDGAALQKKFERCTVTFDGKGNVLISAPDYSVEAIAPSPAGTMPPVGGQALNLSKKYFVVSEQSQPDLTQYDIDLYVDGKWVRKFRSSDGTAVSEVTPYFHVGPNKVLFMAHKNLLGGRRSVSPQATYQITLGEGQSGGDKVVIDTPLLTFKRSADQVDDVSQEFSVEGR